MSVFCVPAVALAVQATGGIQISIWDRLHYYKHTGLLC
jgi:hypothetical protein